MPALEYRNDDRSPDWQEGGTPPGSWSQFPDRRADHSGITAVTPTGIAAVDALFIGAGWTGSSLTFSFPTAASQYTDYIFYGAQELPTFAPLSLQFREAIRQILGGGTLEGGGATMSYGSVASFTNMAFTEVSAGAGDMRFAYSNAPGVAWGYYPWPAGGEGGDAWFNPGYMGLFPTPVAGSYTWLTAVHELGHNLGLKHAHETGGLTGAAMPAAFDSLEYTVMTYRSFVGDDVTGYNNEQFGFPQTFMMLDIRALQQMYGADFTANSGNTIYTWNATTGEMSLNGVGQGAPGANRVFMTVWDGGGVDTYDMSNYTAAVSIDLTPGGFSNTSAAQRALLGAGQYARGNVFNALQYNGDARSLIENAVGTAFADTIVGNAAANTLTGGLGDDILRGAGGVDVLIGGGGIDTADYSAAAAGMHAQLNTGLSSNDGDGGTDSFSGIENLTGSGFNDTLIGNGAVNVLRGGLGTDTLIGLAGNDTLWGGSGAANALQGGMGDDWYVLEANDTVTEFGGEGNDTIEAKINAYVLAANVETLIFTGVGNFAATGNNAASTITGGGGDDNLRGRGGIDVLNGGLGSDTVDYTLAAGAVTARLDQMRATNDGDGATDTYTGVENLTGSNFNDLLIGNGGNNVLMGGVGVDTLLGFGGNDVLHGGPAGGNNQLQGGTGDDWYVLDAFDTCVEFAGEGTDTVEARIGNYVMRDNIENLIYTGSTKFVGTGNALNNHMTGGAQNDILRGMGGTDTILGGLGIDELQVRGSQAQYTVTAEGSGWRIVDSVGGRDGSIFVESIEVLRFITGNTTTALTYPPPAPAPLETASKDGETPLVLPSLLDGKDLDDAFVLPALPDDEPLVLPGGDGFKAAGEPLVLPGSEEAAPDFFGLAAHLPAIGDWMVALDPEGGLAGAPGYRHDSWTF